MRYAHAMVLLAAFLGAPAGAQVAVGDSSHGYVIATEFCAQCHIVTDPQTPPLALGVPSFFDIANDPATTVLSLKAFFSTPHERMPDYLMHPADIDDVIAYILGLRGTERRLPPQETPPKPAQKPETLTMFSAPSRLFA